MKELSLDLKKLAIDAQAECDKAASSQVKNWIKGLYTDIANGEMKAQRLRNEADAVLARANEKKAQLERVLAGEWDAVEIDELRAGEAKGGSDKSDK